MVVLFSKLETATMTTDDQRSIDSSREPASFGHFSQTESLIWRSRSLSELPGHLRVPVLKRKEPERMRARMAAAVAGLAELRQLREKHTAMVLHTVASSGGTPRRKTSVGNNGGGFCYRRMSTGGQSLPSDHLKDYPFDLDQSTELTTRPHLDSYDWRAKRTAQSSHLRHHIDEKSLSSRDVSYSGPSHLHTREREPSTHRRAASVDMPSTQGLEDGRGRLSWENLLSLVGLQSADKLREFDEHSDSATTNDDNVFSSREMVSSVDNENDTSYDRERPYVRAGRSQSFCFGHAPSLVLEKTSGKRPELRQPVYGGSGNMKENDEPQSEKNAREAPMAPYGPVNKATAILRRASIQCESVLTGNAGPVLKRKVLNPLHEIDLEALRSPGPLHAVTLQYSRMQSYSEKQIPARRRSASVDYQTTRQLLEEPKFPLPAARHHSWGNKQLQPIFEDSNIRAELRGVRPEDDATNLGIPGTRSRSPGSVESETTNEILSTDQNKPFEAVKQLDVKVSVAMTNEDRVTRVKKDAKLLTTESHTEVSEECKGPGLNSRMKDNEDHISEEVVENTAKDPGLYQPDTSVIFSDDGYSTCESMSTTSRHTASTTGSKRSSSDWSSLSSGSVSNISLASTFNHPSAPSRRASLSCLSKLPESPKTCDRFIMSSQPGHGTICPSLASIRAISSTHSESLSTPTPQPYFLPSSSPDSSEIDSFSTKTSAPTMCDMSLSADKDTEESEYIRCEGKSNMSDIPQSSYCQDQIQYQHGAKNPIADAEGSGIAHPERAISVSMTAVSNTPTTRSDVQLAPKNLSLASTDYISPRCMNAEMGTPSSYRYKGYPTTRYSVKVNKGVKQTAV